MVFYSSKITDFFRAGFGWQCLRVSSVCILRVLLIMRSNKRTCCCCGGGDDDDELHGSVQQYTHKNDGNCSIAFPMEQPTKEAAVHLYHPNRMHACSSHAHTESHTKTHITCTPFSPIIIK